MPDLYRLEREFRFASRDLRDAADRVADARDYLAAHPVDDRALEKYRYARRVADTLADRYREVRVRLDDIDRKVDAARRAAEGVRRRMWRLRFFSSPAGVTLICAAEVVVLLALTSLFLLRIPVAIWLILFVALAAGVVVLTLAFASVRSRSLTPRLAYLAEEADEADRAAEERGLGRGELADEADRLRDQLDRADQGVEALGKEVAPYVRYDRAVRAHDKARRYYDRVRADYEAAQTERRLRLLRRNWRDLNGRDFELFIREVFDCLGYATELTAKTGDQGIDVIATKDGVRWGIQCKGYADAVGNGPVQEAVAGLKFYRCHRAIVVTTSHFTSGGLALAKVNECLIVEGRDIPALIRGEIRF